MSRIPSTTVKVPRSKSPPWFDIGRECSLACLNTRVTPAKGTSVDFLRVRFGWHLKSNAPSLESMIAESRDGGRNGRVPHNPERRDLTSVLVSRGSRRRWRWPVECVWFSDQLEPPGEIFLNGPVLADKPALDLTR